MNRKSRLLSLFCLLTLSFILLTGSLGSIAAPEDAQEKTDAAAVQAANIIPESASGNATVNATALNMRCGPGTQYEIIGILSKSAPILVLGRSGDWYVVYDYDTGKTGCVNGYYITLVSEDSKDDPKLPGEDAAKTGDNAGSAGSSGGQTQSGKVPENINADALRLLNLVNDIRTRHGLNAVQYSSALSKAAQDKAEDMVRNNYFSHQSALYGTPFEMMRAYGVSFTCAAENIAGNQTADGAFYAWMNSASHKENIMGKQYDRMGIGVCISPIYGKIFVQMFAGS